MRPEEPEAAVSGEQVALREDRIPPPELTSAEKRSLKSASQRLEPFLKVGRHGLSDAFVKSLDEELSRHELVKIKFAVFKEQKKELAPRLAEMTGSHLILLVGNVAVYYRKRPCC